MSDTTWFDFDRLLFDTGQATLQPASQDQLTDIADILKAYPQVKIRIGGYTDNTGDPAANLIIILYFQTLYLFNYYSYPRS